MLLLSLEERPKPIKSSVVAEDESAVLDDAGMGRGCVEDPIGTIEKIRRINMNMI
jgi:hypothetical protein